MLLSRGTPAFSRKSVSFCQWLSKYEIACPNPEIGSTSLSSNWVSSQACRFSMRSPGGRRGAPPLTCPGAAPLRHSGNLAESFQHKSARLRKIRCHLHKIPPAVRITVSHQRFDDFRHFARQGVAHLNDGRQLARPQFQYFRQILAVVLAHREIQRNLEFLQNPYQPAGEHAGPLRRNIRIPLRRQDAHGSIVVGDHFALGRLALEFLPSRL